ncbi:ribonuclease H-like domain-containing protein [Tanacetum coccineum]
MSLHGYSDHEYEAEPTLISKLDLSSPLHLHLNDSATLIVISMKLKGTENYQVWSCAMLLALEGKNKTGFIERVLNKIKCSMKVKCSVFLMGLDDCYMQIRSNILSRDELPDRSQSSVFNSNVRNRNNANVTRPVSNSRPSNVTRHVNNRNRRPNGGLPWCV